MTSATAEINLDALTRPDGGSLHVGSVSEAYAWCRDLATRHYENFPVASILVPSHIRKHMTAVYAISRLGDDIADEPWENATTDSRLAALEFLANAVDGTLDITGHPVLMALRETMIEYQIPADCFHRLFEAFRRDVDFEPPTNWQEILEYCHYSANPVGELVLRLNGITDEEVIEQSDAICSALQVTNFLQDMSLDHARGREYISMPLSEAIAETRRLYAQGARIADHRQLPSRMRLELKAIIAGGYRMLEVCERMVTELPVKRPALTKMDYVCMTWRVITGRWRPTL